LVAFQSLSPTLVDHNVSLLLSASASSNDAIFEVFFLPPFPGYRQDGHSVTATRFALPPVIARILSRLFPLREVSRLLPPPRWTYTPCILVSFDEPATPPCVPGDLFLLVPFTSSSLTIDILYRDIFPSSPPFWTLLKVYRGGTDHMCSCPTTSIFFFAAFVSPNPFCDSVPFGLTMLRAFHETSPPPRSTRPSHLPWAFSIPAPGFFSLPSVGLPSSAFSFQFFPLYRG